MPAVLGLEIVGVGAVVFEVGWTASRSPWIPSWPLATTILALLSCCVGVSGVVFQTHALIFASCPRGSVGDCESRSWSDNWAWSRHEYHDRAYWRKRITCPVFRNASACPATLGCVVSKRLSATCLSPILETPFPSS